MKLETIGFNSIYEVESLTRMLFPGTTRVAASNDSDYVLAKIDGVKLSIVISKDNKKIEKESICDEGLSEKQKCFLLCKLLYQTFCEFENKNLRWGIMTGIRPIKLYHKLREQGLSDNEIKEKIKEKYIISDEMNELSLEISKREKEINDKSQERGFSLYISIPFCPQRCSYCSFVSSAVDRQKDIIPQYVEALKKEIIDTSKLVKKLNLNLQTIYFGGGTPTTLDADQLTEIFHCIKENFDTSKILEYTVEAGRPDTITLEKLQALKNANVDRISVNPQSFSDKTLVEIGRNHTSKQTLESFELAKKVGFKCINMDFIAGLGTETVEEFEESIKTAVKLNPENITVHTLTLKRAATLNEEGQSSEYYKKVKDTTKMVDFARNYLKAYGYNPYYLYRQKNTIGALDNTGYSKKGYEGHYNVFIMDETHTILACGAGAVTKLKEINGEKIQRIYNPKYPLEYIKGIDEVNKKKEEILKFYEDVTTKC